jgi:hypothetical protein
VAPRRSPGGVGFGTRAIVDKPEELGIDFVYSAALGVN